MTSFVLELKSIEWAEYMIIFDKKMKEFQFNRTGAATATGGHAQIRTDGRFQKNPSINLMSYRKKKYSLAEKFNFMDRTMLK